MLPSPTVYVVVVPSGGRRRAVSAWGDPVSAQTEVDRQTCDGHCGKGEVVPMHVADWIRIDVRGGWLPASRPENG